MTREEQRNRDQYGEKKQYVASTLAQERKSEFKANSYD